MARRSIRRQLTQRLLIGMVVFSALSIGGLYIYLRKELYEEYDAALTTEARAISSVICSDETDEQLAEEIKLSFPRMHLGPEEHGFLEVWDTKGQTVIRSASLLNGNLPSLKLSTHEYPIVADVTLPDGRLGRATTLEFDRFPPGSSRIAEDAQLKKQRYSMTLAVRRDELNETLSHMGFSLIFIGLGLTASSVALVVYGVRRELKPLQDFSEQVSQVTAETLAYRLPDEKITIEMLPVRDRLNDLLARLAESFDRERRFSANLAHELRTPIAELRSMIEVAIKWPSDAAGTTRLHGQILDVSLRMSRLVDAMFSLVRAESGQQTTMIEFLSLHELVIAALDRAFGSDQRRAACGIEIDDTITVAGDRTMLEGLIGNLLSNAAQHGVEGTPVQCRAIAATAGSGPRLLVSNTTRDLQPADMARLEEPFWRKDKVRTQGDRLGLGLSLVRDYAKAMNIGVRFSMADATTFVVELRWPTDEPDLSAI